MFIAKIRQASGHLHGCSLCARGSARFKLSCVACLVCSFLAATMPFSKTGSNKKKPTTTTTSLFARLGCRTQLALDRDQIKNLGLSLLSLSSEPRISILFKSPNPSNVGRLRSHPQLHPSTFTTRPYPWLPKVLKEETYLT